VTRPVVLVVLDGFGLGDGGPGDATARAHAPFFARARRDFPLARLETSGEAVGLPPGQMGNSEVGHMTMGAGRVIDQDITRISKALAAGALDRNPAFQGALDAIAASGGRLHLMGLLSDGGVHSHIDHLLALVEHCRKRGVAPVVHAFLDGRDTAPRVGLVYLERLLTPLAAAGGHVATVMGRYFAMDRDNRWDRVARAYDAIVCREGHEEPDALAAVRAALARDEGDEFVQPSVIAGGAALADGDAVVHFNFRADRARELTNALTGVRPERFQHGLTRRKVVKLARFVCFTEYDADFRLPVMFPSETPKHLLGELVAEAGLSQLRAAETEKYAHVTFFFNGGEEMPFPGEDRVLIPSPRDVATYDHKPEMSAHALTRELLERLAGGDYAFVLVNFANPDMVGHTGVLPAAVKAVETVDSCLERISEAVLARGGTLLITADHGNCECMIDPETGGPHTAHTTNPVPIWWVTRDARGRRLRDGTLADLAPTVLELLGLPIPDEMTGRSLLCSA
jgi:2,3-bisphosphoglycerate-independent phosphoglycerate mutase